jgi:hypothetical protein
MLLANCSAHSNAVINITDNSEPIVVKCGISVMILETSKFRYFRICAINRIIKKAMENFEMGEILTLFSMSLNLYMVTVGDMQLYFIVKHYDIMTINTNYYY